ncbi:recombinase family protein [Klebsiella michiganensis]|nr:recombinase family protein [Klebsiella michiganensis]
MLIGYARVSTGDQNLDLQKNALIRAECELIFEDKSSGKHVRRPGLKQAIRRSREGDTLVVWKLDRLGRSVRDLITLLAMRFILHYAYLKFLLMHNIFLFDAKKIAALHYYVTSWLQPAPERARRAHRPSPA